MTVQATKELLQLEKATSAVWKHFGFPSKDGKIVQEEKIFLKFRCLQSSMVFCNYRKICTIVELILFTIVNVIFLLSPRLSL